MYRIVFSICEGPTLMRHNPPARQNLPRPGNFSLIHFEETPLMLWMAFASGNTAGTESRMWTWFSMPPIAGTLMPRSTATDTMSFHKRSSNSGRIKFCRSFLLKTQCRLLFTKECAMSNPWGVVLTGLGLFLFAFPALEVLGYNTPPLRGCSPLMSHKVLDYRMLSHSGLEQRDTTRLSKGIAACRQHSGECSKQYSGSS